MFGTEDLRERLNTISDAFDKIVSRLNELRDDVKSTHENTEELVERVEALESRVESQQELLERQREVIEGQTETMNAVIEGQNSILQQQNSVMKDTTRLVYVLEEVTSVDVEDVVGPREVPPEYETTD